MLWPSILIGRPVIETQMKNISDLLRIAAAEASEDDSRLRTEISHCVPAELLSHICFLRVENRRLRCTMDSAGWASRIRFHGRSIIHQLNSEGFDIQNLSVHVSPQNSSQSLSPQPPSSQSQASQSLTQQAQTQPPPISARQPSTTSAEPGSTQKTRRVTSANSVKHIEQVASGIEDDDLKAALMKLARNMQSGSD